MIAVSIAALGVSGCGSGEYEQLMAARLESLRQNSGFNQLYDYDQTPLEGTQFNLRLPRLFNQPWLTAQSKYEADENEAVDPRRVEPAYLKPLPGFKRTYEAYQRHAEDPSKQSHPVYCHVAAPKADGLALADLEAQLKAKLKKAFPDAAVDWETVSVRTPEGGTRTWRRLRVAGLPQEMAIRNLYNRTTWREGVKATVELYLMEGQANHLLLVFRVPDLVEPQVRLLKLAEATAGTVREEKKADQGSSIEK